MTIWKMPIFSNILGGSLIVVGSVLSQLKNLGLRYGVCEKIGSFIKQKCLKNKWNTYV